MREFYAENGALESIEARVQSDPFVIVTFFRSVNTESEKFSCEVIVVRRHKPAVAHPAEILRRIKTETSDFAHRTGASSIFFRANCLGCIFDNRNPMFADHRVEVFHINALAVEMNGLDRLRSLRH